MHMVSPECARPAPLPLASSETHLGWDESVAEPLPASAETPDWVCEKFGGIEAGVETELSLDIGSGSRFGCVTITCWLSPILASPSVKSGCSDMATSAWVKSGDCIGASLTVSQWSVKDGEDATARVGVFEVRKEPGRSPEAGGSGTGGD
jgi:hypothetical protein